MVGHFHTLRDKFFNGTTIKGTERRRRHSLTIDIKLYKLGIYSLYNMTFTNQKKTYLAKLDKSKKGGIDEKVISLLETINALPDYYTTSSCSGRVYLWKGTGKKSETSWIRVSHDLIEEDFFETDEKDLVWLRLEGVILHVACKDLPAAHLLLDKAHKFYKKSCILSASNKIIVEIRGSEF